jgi:hypothetical protein
VAAVAEVVSGKDRGAENTGPRDLSYQIRMLARDSRESKVSRRTRLSVQEALRATKNN